MDMSTDNTLEDRFEVLLVRIDPHWPDLLRQGSMVRKFADRPDGPFVLQFRQRRTGTRNGRQKRLYIGAKPIADRLMVEIWERREEAGIRYRPGREPDPEERRGRTPSLSALLLRLLEERQAS
jgi:hypothetical protein